MNYFAFFSYARADEKTAHWLHQQLDRFSVPKALVGTVTPRGDVPNKLHPIYRDRTDQEIGGQIDEALRRKLEQSGALIVLCTPAAARSPWVNKECQAFLDMNRGAHIFPVIAAGTPNSGDETTECLPPALRNHGTLAADLRQVRHTDGRIDGDGKEIGKLKLVAGLIGVPLDTLLARERARQRGLAAVMSITAAIFLALAALAVVFGLSAQTNLREAESQRQLADQQRAEADSQRAEAERQRDSANERLEYARQSIGQVIETLVKVGQDPLVQGPSSIYTFDGEDGTIPCTGDAVCTGDREATQVSNRANAALIDDEPPRTADRRAAARFRIFCDSASTAAIDQVLSTVCEHGLSNTGAAIVAVTEISPDLIVTRYGGLAWCGSGGCTDTFTLWEVRATPRALLSCDGDGFAVRMANGSPTSAYCIQSHRLGCGEKYSLFANAFYDVATQRFRIGPQIGSTERSGIACQEEGTSLGWADEQTDDERIMSAGLSPGPVWSDD